MRERALKLLLLSFTSVTTINPPEGSSGSGGVSSGVGVGVSSGGAILLAGGMDEKQVTGLHSNQCIEKRCLLNLSSFFFLFLHLTFPSLPPSFSDFPLLISLNIPLSSPASPISPTSPSHLHHPSLR